MMNYSSLNVRKMTDFRTLFFPLFFLLPHRVKTDFLFALFVYMVTLNILNIS